MDGIISKKRALRGIKPVFTLPIEVGLIPKPPNYGLLDYVGVMYSSIYTAALEGIDEIRYECCPLVLVEKYRNEIANVVGNALLNSWIDAFKGKWPDPLTPIIELYAKVRKERWG